MITDTLTKHAIHRVRHEPRRRMLTVKQVERLTPTMARITLGGDLAGFNSASYDDHVKVFFPLPGRNAPTLPEPGPDGKPLEGVERSPGRDYTPRHYDPAKDELIIDFALHDAGPATTWAEHAKPGEQLAVGGPRGSFVVPDDFDWYLFIGDETAPARDRTPARGIACRYARHRGRRHHGPRGETDLQEPRRRRNRLGGAAAVARRGPGTTA